MAGASDDPLAFWRNMVSSLESNVNSASNKLMEAEHFSKTMNQFASAATGAQNSFNEIMERYLSTLNLPTASQVKDISVRLAVIEGQLSELVSLLQVADAAGQGAGERFPRPSRARRPDAEGEK